MYGIDSRPNNNKKRCVDIDILMYVLKEEIMKRTIENIISIDESGFNNLFLYTKGLPEKGVKINIPVT